MALLTAAQILAAPDVKFEDVEVPEWGGSVRIGTLTAAQRDRYDLLMFKRHKGEADCSIRAAMVAMAAVDEAGAPLFSPDQLAELERKNGEVIARLWSVARRINQVGQEAQEAAEKN